ncbi:LEAF RUST 10 DISEASE-RESISTANCE LOCUS RECEPTOR-LIKE PROTEIN KINASE-like 2.5 [Salvia miltiorrhiza]|uniref:LEAF RUST 10 DISEASE-RESISTANCE LOCUS RECEPTOR-LIKE PROTEIN KINASE-like 2.5 n=1 Tax=Salvia miltiorrhiza TaxID=226208 RepID=UPI0025ABA6AF|nr:LEAF RUST 10 DISEASE-RESISTANCE LOCUS RECEPTOR-LIKE PROTEIN KINASE-like 2.5 [Salvia miltiorrhiza]
MSEFCSGKKSEARMMITQNFIFLFTCSSLLIVFFQTCNAFDCTPSACGVIRNISSPFRLKGDPNHCGDRKYELVCENNVASIHLNSHKYLVKTINYSDFTIRLAHVSISKNTCSFPMSSAYNLFDPYVLYFNQLIFFMSCEHPLQNSSLSTQVTDCEQGRHTYIKVGNMRLADVEYMCTIVSVVATAWNFKVLKNVSLSEIHQSLLYGFTLSWSSNFLCRKCKVGCILEEPNGTATCAEPHSDLYYRWDYFMESFRPTRPPQYEGPIAGCLMVFMVIVAVVFAGVSIPAKIIIGFGTSYWVVLKHWDRSDNQRIIVVSYEVRLIVGIVCGMGFLIYKFRRRRLSVYDEIEGFLQSDNTLSPIRYSYSDIKKITRGFREKLGQGGFGSVYKGKLRSGHHVAVKLLEKSRANGQDFINEIGTIGRIHHVNVVKLVGYCAERSKRALIFDFMPNGSLEKYIFKEEKASSLDWDMKFKIAVGVARGVEYLHRGCDIQILHFDIKPHNILLDDKFVPKISDFGLAKLCSIEKDTVTMTAARGTIGYVAPELINRSIGGVSYKADVYSFGMLLMEMVGLNRGLRGNNDDSSKYFPEWIYDQFNQGKGIEIEKAEEKNSNGDENESRKSLVQKMTIVALWCIQIRPDDRPSMNKVLQMLEADVERLHIPDYPPQSAHVVGNEEESWHTDATDSVSLLHYNNGSSIEITIV